GVRTGHFEWMRLMVGQSVDLSKAKSSSSLQSKGCITTIFAKLHDYSGPTTEPIALCQTG
ncbi:MAG: hypothetical protein ACRBM6_37165, partial [Geminicoccales bacterium]